MNKRGQSIVGSLLGIIICVLLFSFFVKFIAIVDDSMLNDNGNDYCKIVYGSEYEFAKISKNTNRCIALEGITLTDEKYFTREDYLEVCRRPKFWKINEWEDICEEAKE